MGPENYRTQQAQGPKAAQSGQHWTVNSAKNKMTETVKEVDIIIFILQYNMIEMCGNDRKKSIVCLVRNFQAKAS